MTAQRQARLRERIFRVLTRLYPARFREEYEEEMRIVLREDHARHEDRRSRIGFWLMAFAGALREAPRAHLGDLRLDLRYTLRSLRRRPGFVIVAVLSLGIGIGAATTVVATLSALFLQPIPGIAAAERLINIKPRSDRLDAAGGASYPYFLELREQSSSLEDLAGFTGVVVTSRLGPGDAPEAHFGQVVTPSYFPVLGVQPARGRFFHAEEERAATPVVVVSHWFWQNRLAGQSPLPDLWVNGVRLEVVGVATPGFRGNFKGFPSDLYLPLGAHGLAGLGPISDVANRSLELVGRLEAKATREQARLELERLGGLLGEAQPLAYGDLSLEIEPMTGVDADFRSGLLVFLVALLAVTLLILGIAGLNVAGMMASRAVERETEIAVRLALGAPRHRLTRQLVVETLVLASLAAALGAALASWSTRFVAAAFTTVDPRIAFDVGIDGYALFAAISMAFVVSLLCAVAAGKTVSRGSRLVHQRSTSPRQRWRRALVVAQVVLSFVVLVVAILFLRALRMAGDLELGFEPDAVIASSLNPSLAQMEPEAAQRLLSDLREETSSLSGVEVAALATRIPLSLGARFFANPVTVNVLGHSPPAGSEGFAIEATTVSREYFEALGIELVAGRPPTPGEETAAQPVVVVNETFVDLFFEQSGAVGRAITIESEPHTIVGVARDARYRTLDEAPMPFVYRSFAHRQPGRAVLLVRTLLGPDSALGSVRETQLRLAPDLPIQGLGPLSDRLAAALLPQRVGAGAAGALGLLGLFLTMIGLTGVITHWVNSRRREIGLRISIGASPREILRLVIWQGAAVALGGIALGLPLAIGLSSLLRSFLYGISPADPATYLLVIVVQLSAALVASGLPVWRALRLDPLEALRAD